MNSPQQVETVKAVIRIKNKILQSADWEEIAELMQHALDASTPVPANNGLEILDRTMTKEWNMIAVKKLMSSVRERNFTDLETVYPQVATALLRLSMVFVKNGLADVNKILADSLLRKGLFQSNKKNVVKG